MGNYLTKAQLKSIQQNIHACARPLEKAKWAYLFSGGTQSQIVEELVKYQNADGGFGSGLEIDTLTSESSALCSEEAILLAFEYGLDGRAQWMRQLLDYFERTRQDSPSYWELVPKSVEAYPRPDYLKYRQDKAFTPQVCAVVALAMIQYGSKSQKALGNEIAQKCIDHLKSQAPFWFFETQFTQLLYTVLAEAAPRLVNQAAFDAMKSRIDETICLDEAVWRKFVAQPLDLIASPVCPWYASYADAVERNIQYWLDTLGDQGQWPHALAWSTKTEPLRQMTAYWSQYFAVKRVKVLLGYQRVER